MQIDEAFLLAFFKDRPTSAADRIILILSGPGEFETRRIAALLHLAVDIAGYKHELKLSGPIRTDADKSRHLHIHIIVVPHLHLDDAPLSDKRFHLFYMMPFKNLSFVALKNTVAGLSQVLS